MAAYNCGDYVPAIQVFRAMAEQGNAKAQGLLGMMYRRGQGVTRNSARAFLWFSRAAATGDSRPKAQLREVSQAMSRSGLKLFLEIAAIGVGETVKLAIPSFIVLVIGSDFCNSLLCDDVPFRPSEHHPTAGGR